MLSKEDKLFILRELEKGTNIQIFDSKVYLYYNPVFPTPVLCHADAEEVKDFLQTASKIMDKAEDDKLIEKYKELF